MPPSSNKEATRVLYGAQARRHMVVGRKEKKRM